MIRNSEHSSEDENADIEVVYSGLLISSKTALDWP